MHLCLMNAFIIVIYLEVEWKFVGNSMHLCANKFANHLDEAALY